jgi:hypothetical protein
MMLTKLLLDQILIVLAVVVGGLDRLALFIPHQLTVTPPLPQTDRAAAHAVGQDRFQTFIDQVGRRISGGRSLAEGMLARGTRESKQ